MHFERIEQGSPSPQHTVTLFGPPVARAVTPQTSDAWIRTTLTAEGVELSLDTSGIGELQGTVELNGPTGDATIAINAELVAPISPAPPARSEPTTHDPTSAADATPLAPVGKAGAEPEPVTPRTSPYSQLRPAPPRTGTGSSEAAGEAETDDRRTARKRRINGISGH